MVGFLIRVFTGKIAFSDVVKTIGICGTGFNVIYTTFTVF